MKQMELRKIPYGETFSVFGDTFVALDLVDGNVLAIRKEIWKSAPFDTSGVNNLRTASIAAHLVEYFLGLCKQGASEDTVAMNTIDLKATDGTREYGTFGMRAGLLTLEQYGKYQHIIPDVDDWWWLATPWRTPAQKGGLSTGAWCCNSNGNCGGTGSCAYTCGIRPALLFTSSLLVSYLDEDEEAGTGGMTEEEIYAAYLEYLETWVSATDTTGNVGASPESWEAWLARFLKEGHLDESTDAGDED